MKSKEYLRKKLEEEVLLYERKINDLDAKVFETILDRWSDDSLLLEQQRFDLINRLIPNAKEKKILDIAAGCGSFVIQGLLQGYDTHGIEPEEWKQELIDLKFQDYNYPQEWRGRLVKGIGEDLPFEDNSFDLINSWQTIEHVQDLEKCIIEMYRVLKPGGSAVIQGPDYICFYEGHYRMLWFPMLNPKSAFAKFYVGKIRRRPLGGLSTFVPVNPFKLKSYCRKAGFKVINSKKTIIRDACIRRMPILKNKSLNFVVDFIYLGWDFYFSLKNFGTSERTINYLLIKEK